MLDPAFDSLASPRLRIRRFRAEDAEALAAYRGETEVARYQAWEIPYARAEALDFIRSLEGLDPGTPGAWFQFAVTLASSGALIGDCALRCTRADPRQAELGFSFATAHQGQGHAREAVGCLLGYAFPSLGLHRVFSVTDLRNEPAGRLLERLGFRREGCLRESSWFKGEWSSELLYAQLEPDWRRVSRAPGAPSPAPGESRDGGCGCGRVRYRARGPGFDAGFCHCRSCRRASGAPFVAWVTFARADFEYVAGEPAELRSSSAVIRRFCAGCGTPLTYEHHGAPDRLDVTVASMDDAEAFRPGYHIWVSHKLPWVALDDGLPQYDNSRERTTP